jgi:hypothetical protein
MGLIPPLRMLRVRRMSMKMDREMDTVVKIRNVRAHVRHAAV